MLYVIATPIGHPGDISGRAIEKLKGCSIIIGEERKQTSKLLRQLGISGKDYRLLNEHSVGEELSELVDLCRREDVALLSDCGTPGFCDPGADLVQICRKEGIPVTSLPGASSLMTFLSLCGRRTDQFLFRGFLPAKTEHRETELKKLKSVKFPVILMDTPYRLHKTIEDLQRHFPGQCCWVGLDLTQENEKLLIGSPAEIKKQLDRKKAEFILLFEPF